MPEANRKIDHSDNGVSLEGFERMFDGTDETAVSGATASGDGVSQPQLEGLLERLAEIVSISVDQRAESSKLANQIVENQQQLISTQQILIRLMEKSIELTRHISTIEEKLPVLFELPRIVESLKDRVIRLEGIEVD